MVTKKTLGDRIFDTANVLIMILLCLITFYPVYYVIVASLTHPDQLIRHTGALLYPPKWDVESYKLVFNYPMIFTAYKNTVVYVVVGTFLNIFLTMLGGYSLSRKGVPGTKFVMIGATLTMFFSGGLIPRYLLVQELGLINTMWAVLLPTAVTTTNLIIMRTAFANVPEALSEAAKIDGANDIIVLFKVMMPMAMATISVLTLFYAVFHWNEFFTPMIYLKTREKFTLQLLLREILITNSTDNMLSGAEDRSQMGQVIKYAIIVVSTVPILLVYPFLQRYFTKGVMIGAIKG